MLYAVICNELEDQTVQNISKRLNPPAYGQYERLDAQETRQAFIGLAGLAVENVFIDLDAVDEVALVDALDSYRVQRPETRIIIYAPGRVPGDLTMARLRAMSIHDLLAPETPPENMAEFIIQSIQSPPASYASSARWGIGQQAPPAPKSTSGRPLFGGINIRLNLGRKNQETRYVPNMLVAVWSPTGFASAFVALNLAALAVGIRRPRIFFDSHLKHQEPG
jgi:hypothetical protein